MTKFRFKNDLIWQLLCYFVAGFNTIFSIILAVLGLYDEAFALVVTTLLLGILICYRTRREIKMQIQETLDSNKGGKIIAEFVDPGRYLYKISIVLYNIYYFFTFYFIYRKIPKLLSANMHQRSENIHRGLV